MAAALREIDYDPFAAPAAAEDPRLAQLITALQASEGRLEALVLGLRRNLQPISVEAREDPRIGELTELVRTSLARTEALIEALRAVLLEQRESPALAELARVVDSALTPREDPRLPALVRLVEASLERSEQALAALPRRLEIPPVEVRLPAPQARAPERWTFTITRDRAGRVTQVDAQANP